jgi:hypothetical protein
MDDTCNHFLCKHRDHQLQDYVSRRRFAGSRYRKECRTNCVSVRASHHPLEPTCPLPLPTPTDKTVQISSVIPGQSIRVPISPIELSTISGESEVTKYFGVQLDEYLKDQARSDIQPWLCKTFLGGCDVAADKAWTARISWPATVCSSAGSPIGDG